MNTVTIPKKLASLGDLVVIPRKEYEVLLKLKTFKEFRPTAIQKRALKRAKASFLKGKSLSYDELTKKLGLTN